MTSSADVVICGAGIAGITTAYHLAVQHGISRVLLIDERSPLSLTSDKSTECYRNWWPGPGDAMVALMNRSIDQLEALAAASDNIFQLNRRGYLFASADPTSISSFAQTASESAALGAGPLRHYDGQPSATPYQPAAAHGFASPLTGADLISDPALIRAQFPYLSEQTVAVLHTRRCGWFSAQQLGMYMLEQARERGVRLRTGRVTGVRTEGGRVAAVQVQSQEGTRSIATHTFVNAAGPMIKEVGALLGGELPIFSELHIKIAFNDYLGIVPRDAPLLIWNDPTPLVWSAAERETLAAAEETRWLLDTFPAGVHARPEGGPGSNILLILWSYDATPVAPVFPFAIDPHYPEIALRGLATMIPGLQAYLERIPPPFVDGGYYTKTQENRPLRVPM